MIESETRFRSATPELELIFAVVKLAVDDLESNDEQVRFEANEFFLQPRGGWADMRRYYFSLLGLDEERVVEALVQMECDWQLREWHCQPPQPFGRSCRFRRQSTRPTAFLRALPYA